MPPSDFPQARFWIASGWPTTRELLRGGSNRSAECFCSGTSNWAKVSDMASVTAPRLSICGKIPVEQFGYLVLRGGHWIQAARGLILPLNPTIWICNSYEGFHRRIVILENLEEVENAYQPQALHRELGRLDQFDVPPTLLGVSQRAHQQSNSAGIDHGHFRKVV